MAWFFGDPFQEGYKRPFARTRGQTGIMPLAAALHGLGKVEAPHVERTLCREKPLCAFIIHATNNIPAKSANIGGGARSCSACLNVFTDAKHPATANKRKRLCLGTRRTRNWSLCVYYLTMQRIALKCDSYAYAGGVWVYDKMRSVVVFSRFVRKYAAETFGLAPIVRGSLREKCFHFENVGIIPRPIRSLTYS